MRRGAGILVRVSVAISGALLLALALPGGAFASGGDTLRHVYERPAQAHDASAHTYDGALHSVQVHAGEVAPPSSSGAPEGAQQTALKGAGPLSVLSRLSVAADTVGPSVGDLRAAGLSDAHHIIQDAAVRDLPGYATNAAPGVQLSGPSTLAGTEHYAATVVQRAAGGGTYAAERQIAFNALKAAGFSDSEAAAAVARADNYFIKELGVDIDTQTRIPGNRAGQ